MKCIACQTENKEGVNSCKKCGANLQAEPLWKPTWQWHLKVLGIIYVVLIVAYFSISHFLGKVVSEPYRMRHVPIEVTPWLKK